MTGYTSTPDYYNDYIAHYNQYHDPRNGQFTSKKGGVGSIDSKTRKVMEENLTKDIKNNHNNNPNSKKFKNEQIKTLKRLKNEDQIADVYRNKEKIASEMAKDMMSDFSRWAKNENKSVDTFYTIKGKKVSKESMERHLEKELKKKIDSFNSDSIFKFSDGTFTFNIDGLENYQEAQPLYVNYDPKTKKIKDWGYV